jgi:hypothetical protein
MANAEMGLGMNTRTKLGLRRLERGVDWALREGFVQC